MVEVRILRVFTDSDGHNGNFLGVVEDGSSVPDPETRTTIAATLGYSESVFIDDPERAIISIYSPRREVPFAGHAAVGVAWCLSQITGLVPDMLHIGAANVPAWSDGKMTWVRSALSNTPAWWHERLASPADVEALDGPLSPAQDMTQLWSWIDESAGVMRVRTFAGRVGVPEDEACGSGAMRLTAALGRALTLVHGQGSIIHAKPSLPGFAEIGGCTAEDSPRIVRY